MGGVNPMAVNGDSLAVEGPKTAPVQLNVARLLGPASKTHSPAELAKLKEAAQQFEAIFVRQLLKGAKITGKMGDSGYGSMALEALSSGLTQRGGIGLAKAIEDSIRHGVLSEKLPQKLGKP